MTFLFFPLARELAGRLDGAKYPLQRCTNYSDKVCMDFDLFGTCEQSVKVYLLCRSL